MEQYCRRHPSFLAFTCPALAPSSPADPDACRPTLSLQLAHRNSNLQPPPLRTWVSFKTHGALVRAFWRRNSLERHRRGRVRSLSTHEASTLAAGELISRQYGRPTRPAREGVEQWQLLAFGVWIRRAGAVWRTDQPPESVDRIAFRQQL